VLSQAKAKLTAEIEQSKNNPYVQVVGQFLLGYVDGNPHDAEKILVTDKSIAKSLDTMRKEAEKKKVGNCAVLTDQEGFAVVLKYFDIKPGSVIIPSDFRTPAAPQPEPKSKPNDDFDIKLEDLL
jgi:hypothetical protein